MFLKVCNKYVLNILQIWYFGVKLILEDLYLEEFQFVSFNDFEEVVFNLNILQYRDIGELVFLLGIIEFFCRG